MRTTKAILAVSLFLGFMVAPARGDDLNPPPWRVWPDVNTTLGRWEFPTGDNPAIPQELVNPFGPTTLTFNDLNSVWEPDWLGRFGVWMLSGEFWIDIENHDEPLLHKDIWIQITWTPWEDPGPWELFFPGVRVEVGDDTYPGMIVHETYDGPWIRSTYWIRIYPNPTAEVIHVWGDVYVDEVVVDTICHDGIPPIDPQPGIAIPAVSDWGFAVMMLLVLAAGTIVFRRFRAVAA